MKDHEEFDVIAPGDIPEELMEELRRAVHDFSVCIVAADGIGDGAHIVTHGSGTLVQLGKARCILTAGHVWEELRKYPGFGITLAGYAHSFFRASGSIMASTNYDGSESEWGPDLALLRLPEVMVPDIEAKKSFLNMTPRLPGPPDSAPPDHGVWAVVGAPKEVSNVGAQLAALVTTAYFASNPSVIERLPHDYYDHLVDYTLAPDLPRSFGGLSGGGMWHFNIGREQDGSLSWDGRLNLLGVAFYQTWEGSMKSTVRCHGPRSVYPEFLAHLEVA